MKSQMPKEFKERKQWFINRIGKTVYRNRSTCNCESCEDVYLNGITISDEQIASHLFTSECELKSSSELPLRYFDTKEERDDFENSPKKIILEMVSPSKNSPKITNFNNPPMELKNPTNPK